MTEKEARERIHWEINDERDPYERDCARVLHSSAFRRLQNKMQVLFIGASDYYRTRLTHSLEVMQIGRGILQHIRNNERDEKIKNILPSNYLIEAICLAHDLGHPPFGHAGEIALQQKMKDCGGFEGNAQTFRIVSKLGEYHQKYGLNLTRRAMLGIIKYPIFYENAINNEHYVANLSSKPPKCLYLSEKEIFEWLLNPFSKNDRELFQSKKKEGKYNKSQHKTLDCSIMEMADDIAYAIHDFEDAIKTKIITKQFWDRDILSKLEPYKDFVNDNIKLNNSKKFVDFAIEKLFDDDNKKSKIVFSKLINFFIENTEINIQNKDFDCSMLKYKVSFKYDECKKILKIINDFVYKKMIQRAEGTQLEFKGRRIISKLYDAMLNAPKDILPEITYSKYKESEYDKRVLSDYISGMTDNYAIKIYRRIFDASYGSAMDMI